MVDTIPAEPYIEIDLVGVGYWRATIVFPDRNFHHGDGETYSYSDNKLDVFNGRNVDRVFRKASKRLLGYVAYLKAAEREHRIIPLSELDSDD